MVPVLGGGGETVAASVALQLLLAVFTVKVILTGRAEVQELAGGGPRGSVDRSGGSACLDAAEDRLTAVSAMGSTTGSFRRLLPIIVEGD